MVSIDPFSIEPAQVARIRDGNEAAFQALYLELSPSIFHFLLRKVRDRQLAEDLVQDLFVRIWKKRKTLDPKQSLKAYMYTTATRLAIDHLRKSSSQRETQDEELVDLASVSSHEIQVVQRQEIRNALEILSATQRTVFCLSRFEGLTYVEIAEYLNVSAKTVETHMSRALAKIRELINPFVIILLTLSGLSL